jgi:hypothetical protein
MGAYLGADVVIGNQGPERGIPSVRGHENDCCIFVKGQPPDDFPEHSYLDMMDAKDRFPWLDRHPEIGLISISETAHKCMEHRLSRHDIHFIPEATCNWERERRDRDEIRRAGVMGNNNSFWGYSKEIEKKFSSMGIEFHYEQRYQSRRDVIEFYRSIDIQCVWRPHLRGHDSALRNPLKIGNAGSFGIPTVAYPEPAYVIEGEGCFIPVETMEDMFREVGRLQSDPIYYRDMAQLALARSEKYHIDVVSKLYRQLPGAN